MPMRFAHRVIIVLIVFIAAAGLSGTLHPPQAALALPGPHLGYGISVAPHIAVPDNMLTNLGLDWVLVYDTDQVGKFPGQKVAYRTDVRGYPDNPDAFEAGIADLARKLSNAGVKAMLVGNEPNLIDEWGGHKPDALKFTDALCRAYRAIKSVAPDMIVVSGGLAPGPDGPRSQSDFTYTQQMLDANADACFDAFGYHPYGFNQAPEADPNRNPYSFRRAELMHNLLLLNNVRKPMWITEFGWVRDPAEDGMDCSKDSKFVDFQWMIVSRNTQASYISRAFTFADENWPWVGPMFLWNLNWSQYPSSYEPPCSHLRHFAITKSDGSPLPSFFALQQLKKRIPDYGPRVGASARNLSRIAEAGCAGVIELGSFTLYNAGYPGELEIDITPTSGPGVPLIAVDVPRGRPGQKVQVVVDARGLKPGLYLIPINVRSTNLPRVSAEVVRAYLLINPPTTPECVQRYNSGG